MTPHTLAVFQHPGEPENRSARLSRAFFLFLDGLEQDSAQCAYLVGLLDETGESFGCETRNEVLFIVSARQEDASLFANATHLAEGLLAIQMGHGEIEDDDVKTIGIFLE